MHRLINEIIIALENKQYYTSPFMDIEKVFDKINHESVLQTIRKQFPKQIHQLIKSYLSSRTFVIKIKDTYSEVKHIKAGVPQGSVLGPILCTLYTANILTTINNKILTFADDTASSGNDQHFKYGKKTKKETLRRPHKGYNLANARMVSRWG